MAPRELQPPPDDPTPTPSPPCSTPSTMPEAAGPDAEAFDAAYRRYVHRKQVTSDMTAQGVGAVVLGVCGTWLLVDGRGWPALCAFLSTVLSLAGIAFITYRTRLWRRYRELFLFAAGCLHYSVAAFVGASGLNFMAHHGGSCFRSFAQFAYSNSAVWQLLNALLCRVLFRRLLAMQLLLVLVPLRWGGRLCRDALSHPGTEADIRRFYRRISSMSPFAGMAAPGAPPPPEPAPLEMCCTVNMWSLVACAVAALYITFYTEQRHRPRFMRSWRPRSSSRGSSDTSASVSGSGNSSDGGGMGASAGGAGSHGSGSSGSPLVPPPVVQVPPPPLLWRGRHRRLQHQLAQLRADPSGSAERRQEALVELLRARPPRSARLLAAEAALVCVLSWQVCVVMAGATAGWTCAA